MPNAIEKQMERDKALERIEKKLDLLLLLLNPIDEEEIDD